MFGLKIRSWMETHLVRSRKKRNKDGGNKIKQEKSPPDHIAVVNNEFEYKSAKIIDTSKKLSPVSTIKTQASSEHSSSSLLKAQSPFTCVVNLSSPESAYSTGYSTDGTSPGASLPPEYYINIRTGTHYFQSNRVEKLTPRSARRKKDEAKRKKHGDVTAGNAGKHLPESSTEDEILNTDSATEERLPTHRRTESCDENNLSTVSSPPTSSPYLPGASPRPRNRIRTNPWLSSSPGSVGAKPALGDYSAVDSSSTVSSSSCRDKHVSPHRKLASPRKKVKDTGCRVSSPSGIRRSSDTAITTCSPLSARHCPHTRLPLGGSSSSPLSSSDDDNQGNTSDFSDDDVTLNEMLGKYDESYTYEKETDILSDSDLTDVEEDKKNLHLDFLRRDLREDFDFIDNGSSVAQSENNSPMPGKKMNTGHCYYHLMGEKVLRQRSVESRSSSRSSSVVKRSKKSESERRRKSRNPSQEKLPFQFKPCSPLPKNEKHLNMNKILAERLNPTQDRGTQSASTTPICVRKRLTDNGKYLKNDYITNLINSNLSLSEKNRNSIGNLNDRKLSLNTTSSTASLEQIQQKKRSNSLTQDITTEPEDLKYKKLTEEANYIIEKLEICKLDSMNRRGSSTHNSPTRSKTNFPLEYAGSYQSSPIKHANRNMNHTKSDFESRNYMNRNIDPVGKCWSPLKVRLLKQNQNHMNNMSTQSMNSSPVSSPVKMKMHNKHFNPGDVPEYENFIAHSPKHFSRTLNYKEQEILGRNETTAVHMDYRNNNKQLIGTRNRNTYAAPYEYLDANKPQNVPITLRDGNNLKKNMINAVISSSSPIHQRYNGDLPTYENVNLTTFSRPGTPTKSPYTSQNIQMNHMNATDQIPPKIPINTQTYKLTKCKYTPPPSPLFRQNLTKPALTTFQKPSTVPTSYHTRSTADILSDSKQKPTLLSNFKSLDLGPQNPDLYCPRSEPVKRKVYACSISYGKLQKSLKGGHLARDSETCIQLRNSVAQLRKERFYVEAKLRKTQQQINKIRNDF